MITQIPPHAVIARYKPVANGWAVVTASGKVLAPSFYDLRNRYSFFMSINGAGGWVVLLPKAIQEKLF